MDLAFFVRDPRLDEPIFPLTVARDGSDVDVQVAAGERLLSHAVLHAAAADVPVLPLTRVDESVAQGIVRAVKERRASTLIIGWNGQPSAQQRIFGGVLDQVLDETDQMVFVCRLDHPLNTTERVVLAVPPFAEREAGFGEVARSARLLASQMGARLVLLVDPLHLDGVRRVVDGLKPEADVAYPEIGEWADLLPYLNERLLPNDLLVLVGAREGTLSWRPAVNRLPRVLSQRFLMANFITVYPSEAALDLPAGLIGGADAGVMIPAAVLAGLEEETLEAALNRLLREALSEDDVGRLALRTRLMRALTTYAIEVRPGVALLHTTGEEVTAPTLLVATSVKGFQGQGLSGSIQVLLVLLSPDADAPERHLRTLARIARLMRADEMVAALQEAGDAQAVRSIFAGSARGDA